MVLSPMQVEATDYIEIAPLCIINDGSLSNCINSIRSYNFCGCKCSNYFILGLRTNPSYFENEPERYFNERQYWMIFTNQLSTTNFSTSSFNRSKCLFID